MIKQKLTSRKLWIAIIAMVGVMTNNEISPEVGEAIAAGIAGIYIIAEAVIDKDR